MIAVLAGRSKRRILEDEYFQKIAEELADRESDDGVVRLAELIREREEANGRGEDRKAGVSRAGEAGSADSDTAGLTVPTESGGDADPSPQIREALEILTDMITLSP
jgi:hypothetical protein